jgi:hypothetical protein
VWQPRRFDQLTVALAQSAARLLGGDFSAPESRRPLLPDYCRIVAEHFCFRSPGWGFGFA